MSSRMVDLADAVVTSINGASLPTAIAAERKFYVAPSFESVAAAPDVFVMPMQMPSERLTRGGAREFSCRLDVGVIQHHRDFEANGPDTLELLEAIDDHLHDTLTITSGSRTYHWESSEYVSYILRDHLESNNQVTGVIRVTYRLVE